MSLPIVELTCISCPLGCPLKVETDNEGKVLSVTGNTCKRGEDYGRKEVTAPTRSGSRAAAPRWSPCAQRGTCPRTRYSP